MALDKVVDSSALDAGMTSVADAIRAKAGTTDQLLWPDGFKAAIEGISGVGDTSIEDGLVERTITDYVNDRVESVGPYAFYLITSLLSVSMKNVKIFNGQNNFMGCTNLSTIDFPKLESASTGNAFRNCTALTNAVLPRLVNPGVSFQGCSALGRLDLGSEVDANEMVQINFGNVSGCTNLTAIILRYKKILLLSRTSFFDSTPIVSGDGYIYVPSELVDGYKAATNWSVYADQIRAIEDYPEITGGAA